MVVVSILTFGFSISTTLLVVCFFNAHSFVSSLNDGSPLFITPLLEANQTLEAQVLSRVKPDIANTTCYSGFFTVNKECESNLFFWFCKAQTNWDRSPVLLWLQGGPGASSLFGLFWEIGPFYYKDGIAMKREFTWSENNNLLFIDQPVETGFSFTRKKCYAKNKNDIAKDLYSAIVQFYQLFPTLKSNNFFITGESYAGHYIPYIAHYIHKMNPTAKDPIELSGMMIGNGWMDAYYQYDYGDFLYHIGLINEKQNETIHEYVMQFRNLLNAKQYSNASKLSQNINSFTWSIVKDIDDGNYLRDKRNKPPYGNITDFSSLRKSINVGSQTFKHLDSYVYNNLVNEHVYDGIQSVKAEVEELLEHYPIVFYFGQLDTLCPYSVALSFLRGLRWSGTADYQQAPRHQWCVDGQLSGFYRSSHNLHEVLIRNAGHSVPLDQPLWAFILANSVTSSPSDDPLQKLVSC